MLTPLALPVRAAPAPSFTPRVWQTDDGLPDNRVTGLVQAPDGFIWVATRGGLVRFDGFDFERFDLVKAVTGNGVRALYSDRSGDLWIGAYREAVLRVSHGSVQRYTPADGIPTGQFNAFAEDKGGVDWFAFGSRIYRLAAGRFQAVSTGPDDVAGRAALACDSQGMVWACDKGRVGTLGPDGFVQRYRMESRSAVLAPARAGGVWACGGSQLIRLQVGAGPVRAAALPPAIVPSTLAEDRSGAVWIGTVSDGLFRFDGTRADPIPTSHRDIASVLLDREDHVWVGTFGGGLNLLLPSATELTGPAAGLPFESVHSVCQDSLGGYWAVSATGQLARGDGRTWVLTDQLGTGAACVAADRGAGLWVGTHALGLRRLDLRSGQVQSWTRSEGLPSDSIRALLPADDGSVWFSTNNPASLVHLDHGVVQTLRTPGAVRNIRALAQTADRRVWAGTSDGQVLQVVGDALTTEPALAHAGTTSVRCLAATGDGALWIGYAERGIGLLKNGHYVRIGAEQGLMENSLWQIAGDQNGMLWLAGAHGLCRISIAELTALAEGRSAPLHPMLFGYKQGLPNLQPNYDNAPAICPTADHRILFATSLGILALNPKNIPEVHGPVPISLERVSVDEQPIAVRGGRLAAQESERPGPVELGAGPLLLRIGPGPRRLAFDFVALNYAAPGAVHLRYRLNGWDDRWTETGGKASAVYSWLPPGRYTFQVAASDGSGQWSDPATELRVAVQPFYWQTWWFRAALVGLFTTGIAGAVRYFSFRRLRQRLKQAEQRAALFQERTRIARDIHDDVGGSLSHIKLLSEIAVQQPGLPEPALQQMRQITDQTRHVLKSLDETIWAINPRNDTLPHLISYLGQYAVELLRAANIRCRVDLPENPPNLELASAIRHHVHLVVKESLTNVVRHSGAQAASLQVEVIDRVLRVVIEDDGQGFANEPDNAVSDGIRNMRQRIASVGGQIRIVSQNGNGARIDIEVPLPQQTARAQV